MLNRGIRLSWVAAMAVAMCATAYGFDFKIKQKTTVSGMTYESTTLIKGKRQRSEQGMGMGAKVSTIRQCDLRRDVQVNDTARTYLIQPFEDDQPVERPAAQPQPAPTPQTARRGGVVTITITTTDTGERKQMFGLTARHIKQTFISESSPDACNQQKFKMEKDGWYVDLEYGLTCEDRPELPDYGQRGSRPDCRDQMRFRREGGGRLGLPVWEQTTMYDDKGKVQMTILTEVLEISSATLDQALFDIPAGYREVKNSQELYGTPSVADMMAAAMAGRDSAAAQPTQTPSAAATASDAKPPGTIRVGVIQIGNRTGQPASADSMRYYLIEQIKEQGIDAVALTAELPSQLEAEAKAKQCDFILYTDLTELKQSSANKVGGFLGRATGVADVRERFEVKIEYRLLPAGSSSPVLQSSSSAKEDGAAGVALNAALDKEAQAVAKEARKRRQ